MINFKVISAEEAIAIALDEARIAANAITKLANTPLAAGETHETMTAKVFRHAINLAAAFTVLDQIAAMAQEAERAHNDSPQTDLPKAGVSSGIN